MPASVTDPLGRTTSFLWTPSGEPAAVQLPDGSLTTNDVRRRRPPGRRSPTRAAHASLRARRRRARHAPPHPPLGGATWYDIVGCATSVLDAAAVRGTSATTGSTARSGGRRPGARLVDRLRRPRTASRPPPTRAGAAANTPTTPSDAAPPPSALRRDGRLRLRRLRQLDHLHQRRGRVYTMAYDALGRIVAATNAANEQVFRQPLRPRRQPDQPHRRRGQHGTPTAYDELNRLVMQESGHGSPASFVPTTRRTTF
jgi:YD repeat-containing protein